MHLTRHLPHGALDFRVPGVPDENDFIPLPRIALRLDMNLAHQRTGGVDDLKAAAVRGVLHFPGYAVGAEHGDRALGDIGNRLHKARALLA